MAYGPITSWQIEGEKVEAVTDFFFFFVSKITMDGDYSHKRLAPWKEIYDKPRQHISQKHHFADKGLFVQAMVFPVLMYRSESWTIKKDGLQEWMFLNCGAWRRLLRVAWIARRSNQSILKKMNTKYS